MPVIAEDDLSDASARALVELHLRGMYAHSPPGAVFALDLSGLKAPGVTFWTARENGEAIGMAALKDLGDAGELKSMRTAATVRGQGVGRAVLEHILGQAVDLGYQRISLETGSQPFFEPAHQLYLRYGFADCAPFGSYGPDPHSRFMTRAL